GAGWRASLRAIGAGVALVICAGFVLAWQGGGAIGSGRLSAFGASPWKFGLLTGGAVGVAATATVGAVTLLGWSRARRVGGAAGRPALAAIAGLAAEDDASDDAETDILAG